MTRRDLLVTAAAARTAMGAGTTAVPLGGPVFLKSDDPAELAREHRRLGYAAAYCPAVKLEDKDRIKAIEKAFAQEKVIIAEVGAWVNLLDPDAEKRAKNVQYVKDRLALADEVGARCCVDIAGSFNDKAWDGPHPKNLSAEFLAAVVEVTRKIVDSVKPKRTRFTLEMMGWMLPDSPDAYLRMIKAMDRPAFAVHLDPCNVISSPQRFYESGAFINECFQKLGRWIASCHAKDLAGVPGGNVQFREVIPGRGQVDYAAYLRCLAKLPRQVPLMLEHLKTAEEYAEGAAYIRKVAASSGVEFA